MTTQRYELVIRESGPGYMLCDAVPEHECSAEAVCGRCNPSLEAIWDNPGDDAFDSL
jgi:hypothetical protein